MTRPVNEPYERAGLAIADPSGGWLLPSERKRKRSRSTLTLPVLVLAALLVIAGGGIAAFALGGGTSNTSTPTTPSKSTATTKPAATATATLSPTVTSTVTASTSNANAAAAASFQAVTVGTGVDGTCASGKQTTTFSAGQTIYVNLCTSQSVAGLMTVTLQHNGQVAHSFTANTRVAPGSHYFYYDQHTYPAGSYDVVVTMQVNGQTGVARTISITIQ